MVEFNLSVAFNAAFGYKTSAFEPNFIQQQPDPNNYRGLEPDFKQGAKRLEYGKAAGTPYYAKSLLGVEYFLPVTLTYTDSESTGEVSTGRATPAQSSSKPQYPGIFGEDSIDIVQKWDLPFPVISIQNRKKIIKTELTERIGPVMEMINFGAYEINIKGFFISGNDDMPEDLITQLRNIHEQKTPIQLSNALTDIFLVRPDRGNYVVLEDFRLPVLPGVPGVRPYECFFTSVAPFNLIEI